MSDTSSRPRRKFTREFKAEAVAMVEASSGQIAKVARELNIHDSSLGSWVRQARVEAEEAPTAEKRAETRDLKREMERVRRMHSTLDYNTPIDYETLYHRRVDGIAA